MIQVLRLRLRLRISLVVLVIFIPLLVQANDGLVKLYRERMHAEMSNDIPGMIVIDTKLAEHYISVNDYDKGRFFLEKVISNASEPELTDRKLDLYRLDIIKSNFDRAESGLISILFYSKNNEQKARASYLLGILKALDGEYERSREFLTQSLKLQNVWTPEFESDLDSLLVDARKRKNKETAKWLSTFLPGAGQIYAKNAKGAIGAIGIAAFWGGWFVYDLIQQDYYSAALVLFWPWQRYHRGNIQNAGYSVEDFNARIEDGINRALLDYLSTK